MNPTPAASAVHSDVIDPKSVPQRTLNTGATIPAIGMGTFGSDHVSHQAVSDAVRYAASIGYGHFDCAAVYGNEDHIGLALADVFSSGVKRESVWITSKVWNDRHNDVIGACEQSLKDLRLEYLDLYLVHWPFPNHHPPGCDVSARNPHAVPFVHARFMETWGQMEELVRRGLVRHIGTSNMTITKMKPVLRDASIRPVVNEMELHPHFQQPEFFQYLLSEGIQPIGYSPLGSPGRPERDRTPEDTSALDDPAIREIASRHGIHPAAVCLKWAVQRGQVPIPFSTNPRNLLANLQAVVSAPLSAEEMATVASIDRNCRLIKGQVFLWKENQPWQDLWDEPAEVTTA